MDLWGDSNRKKVSIGGSSRSKSEDRETVLAKARRERAERSRRRAESSATLTIQRVWRGYRSRRDALSEFVQSHRSCSLPCDSCLAGVAFLGLGQERRCLSLMLRVATALESIGALPWSTRARKRRLALLAVRCLPPAAESGECLASLCQFAVILWERIDQGDVGFMVKRRLFDHLSWVAAQSGKWQEVAALLPTAMAALARCEATDLGEMVTRVLALDLPEQALAAFRKEGLSVLWRSLSSPAASDAIAASHALEEEAIGNFLDVIRSDMKVSYATDSPSGLVAFGGAAARIVRRIPHGAFPDLDRELLDDDATYVEEAHSIAPPIASAPSNVPSRRILVKLQMLFQPEILVNLIEAAVETCRKEDAKGPDALARVCDLVQAISLRQDAKQRGSLIWKLSFSSDLAPRMWMRVKKLQCERSWPEMGIREDPSWVPILAVFCPIMSMVFRNADDVDFFESNHPVNPHECEPMVELLRDSLWRLAWVDPGQGKPLKTLTRIDSAAAIQDLLGQLNARNARRQFMDGNKFLADELRSISNSPRVSNFVADACEEGKRAWDILRRCPSLAPFDLRVRALQEYIRQDKARLQRDQGLRAMGHEGHQVSVRRGYLFEDGFRALYGRPERVLKGPLRVDFVDAYGYQEAGVDGGGLLKDFLDSLCKDAFSPDRGLFVEAEEHRLYPNPASGDFYGASHLAYFEFLGSALGKAIYEGILVELPMAHFFLSKLRGRSNGFNDLYTLDKELHRSLSILKRYQGDVSAMGLTFTVTKDVAGYRREEELEQGGRNTPVSNENKNRYVRKVAHYKLNSQIEEQSKAFLRGFKSLISPGWLHMFNEEEIQMLISGSLRGALDIDDMRVNCRYSGGYHPEHPTVRVFWDTLRSFTPDEQRLFLRFVTACSNPPLLGFGDLQPPFTIHMASVGDTEEAENERLPSASTCMNVLKLPPYRSSEALRRKLEYAITSSSGFHLS